MIRPHSIALCVALCTASRTASAQVAAAPQAPASPPAAASAPVIPAPTAPATVVFGGDVVPHGDVLRSMAAHGDASLLAPVASVLRAADLALLNLETPAAPSRPEIRAGLQFNVHANFVRALADVGVDAVSIANNHAYDQGVDAVAETVRTVRDAGMRPIGAALPNEDPYLPQEFPLAGSTLCVFAVTRLLNFPIPAQTPAQPRVALARRLVRGETQRLLQAIAAHRTHCGAVIVSLHSGVEYQNAPEAPDRTFFRQVADAGADVVIGHHSHTPHPVEAYVTGGHTVPIFFSLGNFVSNQGNAADSGVDAYSGGRWQLALDARTREGLLAVLRFERGTGDRLRLAQYGYVPLWTINTRWRTPRASPMRISAALMPRDGGGDRMLSLRWTGLVRRVGESALVPVDRLPGGDDAYRTGTPLVLENRVRHRATASATPSAHPGGS